MNYHEMNDVLRRKWLGRVRRALIPSALIRVVEGEGIEAGIRMLQGVTSNEVLADVVGRMYVDVGIRHARLQHRGLSRELRKQSMFDIWLEFIKEYLHRYLLSKITYEVADTARNYMLRVLQRGLAEGMGYREMARQLADLPFTRYQALRIVRTEVNRAANVGHMAQADAFGFELMKEWVSGGDSRVRGRRPHDKASHYLLNGTRIDEHDKFIDPINGDRMDGPGDPEASAESVINCRCRVVYTPKRDDRGRLIPKQNSHAVQGLQLQG